MSCAPMAPGTALNEAGVVAVWASAGGLISRLPPATPMASPIANDNPTVTVLLIAFLPACTTQRSYSRTLSVFRGCSGCNYIVYWKSFSLNYSAADPRQCTSTPVHWHIAPNRARDMLQF